MTNDERNTALATLIGAEGYESAEKCLQGHEGWNIAWFVDDEPSDLCFDCVYDNGMSHVRIWEMNERAADPTWHPEWRFPQVVKPFDKPGVLEPLARELLARWTDSDGLWWGWTIRYTPYASGDLYKSTVRSLDYPLDNIAGFGAGPTYEIALGEALLDAARNR